MANVSARMPVLVGVGLGPTDGSVPAADLMLEAVLAAGADSTVSSLLSQTQWIATPVGTWSLHNVPGWIANELGAQAYAVMAEAGIPQQSLINEALSLIRSGEIDVAVVVGGDAKGREVAARRAAQPLEDVDPSVDTHALDEHRRPAGEIVAPPEIAARLYNPVEQYALIDSARRVAAGFTLEEHRCDISALWSRWSTIASGNPRAAFGEQRTAEFLANASPDNRPLASPYNKWHSTQWGVNQSAALLLCSAERAEAAGVPRDRWVVPQVGIESSHSLALSRRAEPHRWPAMHELGRAAGAHIGRPLSEVEFIELYSCFPVAVRIQQAELGLDPALDCTVTGGMAFAGGPFNNFVFQATVEIAERVRANPGCLGMVSTVSGLLTKPGLAVWGTEPVSEVLIGDYGEAAAAATREAPLVDPEIAIDAKVVAATVLYDRAGNPDRVAALVRTTDGAQTVAVATDSVAAQAALTEELVGSRARAHGPNLQL